MTLELSNSHMFFAYHIRSASLAFEQALGEMLNKNDISAEQFYVLRCEWKTSEMTLEDLRSHAILTREDTIKAVNDLVAKDYVIKGIKEGFYSLSALGVSIRQQLLKSYREHISKAMQGLSDKNLEATLTSLLTVQHNIQET